MNDREKVAREGQGYPCYQARHDDGDDVCMYKNNLVLNNQQWLICKKKKKKKLT